MDGRARCRWGLMMRDASAPRCGGRAWPDPSRPETRAFSFPFQGGPSSYEETPGALGTGPERAAVWGDRRCGGGSSRWGGGPSAPSCVHSAQLPTGSPSQSPGEWGMRGRTEAPPHLPAPDTPTVGGASGAVHWRCPRCRSLRRISMSF